MRSCCVTGHREIPADKAEYVKARLLEEVRRAIGEGYTRFITGMAEGADMFFADIVLGFRRGGAAIELHAYIPYRGRLDTPDADFQRIIAQCDNVIVCSDAYSPNCFMVRNKAMVNAAELVIAVYGGREKSGTAATMRYAARQKRDVRVIAY